MNSKFLPIIKDDVGSIVSVSSTYVFSSRANKSAYSAAKAGIVGFTKITAIEAGRWDIRDNAACPGPVLTPRRLEAGTVEDCESGGFSGLRCGIVYNWIRSCDRRRLAVIYRCCYMTNLNGLLFTLAPS